MKRLIYTLAIAAVSPFLNAEQQERPNFVIIYTDDHGYGDLGCYGSQKAITPRIDQMAAEGAKLTSFYMAAPYCTPSRAALMTGTYPIRNGMAGGVMLAADERGLHPNEITVAEVLRDAGYKTGMFGKWHLGDQPQFMPTAQGFEEFFGLPYSHDIHPFNPKGNRKFPPLPLLEGEEVIELDPDADYLTKRFTDRAVDFIAQNKEKPFFLYVPHPLPHRPIHTAPEYLKSIPEEYRKAIEEEKVTGQINYDVRDKLYYESLQEIDWSVGKILDALKENGVDENTIVLFTADNGQARPPVGIGTAHPLKGSKGVTAEGGLRVPTVIRWPKGIQPGSDTNELLTAMDLLPTFARLAGGELPTDRMIDGKDILQCLTEGAKSPHEVFFYYRINSLQAVRAGKWKLHLKGKELYDLDADVGESTNVFKDNPEVVKELKAHVAAFQKKLKATRRPQGIAQNPKPLTMK